MKKSKLSREEQHRIAIQKLQELTTLKFPRANDKLKLLAKELGIKYAHVHSLDTLAGSTCPMAKDCLGEKFSCYAKTLENVFPLTYAAHYHNTALLRGCQSPWEVCELVLKSIPPRTKVIRISSSGDIESLAVLLGYYWAIRQTPHIRWYGYTKSIGLFLTLIEDYMSPLERDQVDLPNGRILPNWAMTASRGGKQDSLIDSTHWREAEVVPTVAQARFLVNHNDLPAYTFGGSFSLVVHGTQKAGTELAKLHKIHINNIAKLNKRKKNLTEHE